MKILCAGRAGWIETLVMQWKYYTCTTFIIQLIVEDLHDLAVSSQAAMFEISCF